MPLKLGNEQNLHEAGGDGQKRESELTELKHALAVYLNRMVSSREKGPTVKEKSTFLPSFHTAIMVHANVLAGVLKFINNAEK